MKGQYINVAEKRVFGFVQVTIELEDGRLIELKEHRDPKIGQEVVVSMIAGHYKVDWV